jgi:hypothetical protein
LRQRADIDAMLARAALGGGDLRDQAYLCESVAVANLDPAFLAFLAEHERFGREMADKLVAQSESDPPLPYGVAVMRRTFREAITAELAARGLPPRVIDLLIECALIGFFTRDCELALTRAGRRHRSKAVAGTA